MKEKILFAMLVLLAHALLFMASSLPVFGTIKHIRWGSSGDPLTGLTITWRNNGTADSIKWGYTASMDKGIFAGAKRNGYEENFFNYTFPTATPNATIYYQLYDSNSKSWGSQKTFTTGAPSNTQNFSFCVLGDSRNGLTVWNQIANLANAKNADLALFNGDIVDNGGSNSQWNNWFSNGTTYLENNIVYHALGNHDAANTPLYQNNFELPRANGTNLYYSFTYGNTIFITLNSQNSGSSAQATWLVNTLSAAAANPEIKWKVVSFHKPFYTSGTHAGEMNSYFNTWWKAFDDYGVDLIVNGHDHMYERTKPINRKVSTSSPVSKYGSEPGQGRCQIVSGGAGAPLYSGSTTWAIQVYKKKYNFCVFDIKEYVLTGISYDNYGAVIDSFTIDKTPANAYITSNVNSSICAGDSIFLGGDWQTAAGTYIDTIVTSGNDTVKKTTLAVKPTYNTTKAVSICAGDSLLLNGTYHSTSGTFKHTLTAANGCDSVITYNLTIAPLVVSVKNLSICDGDSVLINGDYQSTAGTFFDTLATEAGCDSIVKYNLSVSPSPEISKNVAICLGDSIYLQGDYQTSAGTYYEIFTSSKGCDSTVITTLSVVSVDSCSVLGINDVDPGKGIMLYPNPNSTGKFSITVPEIREKVAEITVLNMLGEMVYVEKIQVESERISREIDLENVSKGTYLVQVKAAGKTFSRKLIIE